MTLRICHDIKVQCLCGNNVSTFQGILFLLRGLSKKLEKEGI
jgi:hypothetical protein